MDDLRDGKALEEESRCVLRGCIGESLTGRGDRSRACRLSLERVAELIEEEGNAGLELLLRRERRASPRHAIADTSDDQAALVGQELAEH